VPSYATVDGENYSRQVPGYFGKFGSTGLFARLVARSQCKRNSQQKDEKPERRPRKDRAMKMFCFGRLPGVVQFTSSR
jgi:hypothetical protein